MRLSGSRKDKTIARLDFYARTIRPERATSENRWAPLIGQRMGKLTTSDSGLISAMKECLKLLTTEV